MSCKSASGGGIKNEFKISGVLWKIYLIVIVKMQNICNLIDQNSVHASDIFKC